MWRITWARTRSGPGGPSGIEEISRTKAKGWFGSDSYFNRSRFPNAVGKYNAKYHTYELHLSAVGSSNLDRWVSYDIANKTWWGPHKTDAFTPTWASTMLDTNNLQTPIIGSSAGFLYTQNRTVCSDDATAVSMDLITKAHDGGTPDIEKYFGEMAIISKVQTAGTLKITPTLGGTNSVASAPLYHDLRRGRERLGRLGTGRFCQLEFTEATAAQSAGIYGYEIPIHEIGRR
jgi:hypothetical protein